MEHNRRYEDTKLTELQIQIANLETKVDTLQTDIEALVSAWKAASWVVSFVKWAGGIATAITAILILFKGK